MRLLDKIKNWLREEESSEHKLTRIYSGYDPDSDFFPEEQENTYMMDFNNLFLEKSSNYTSLGELVRDSKENKEAYSQLEYIIRNFEDIVDLENGKSETFFRAVTTYLSEHQEDFSTEKVSELFLDLLKNSQKFESSVTVRFILIRSLNWKRDNYLEYILQNRRNELEEILEENRSILRETDINNESKVERCYKHIHILLIEKLGREDVRNDLIQEMKSDVQNSAVFDLNSQILEEVDEDALIERYREIFRHGRPFNLKQVKAEMKIMEKLAEEKDGEMHDYLLKEIRNDSNTLSEVKEITKLLTNYSDENDFKPVAERYRELKDISEVRRSGWRIRSVLSDMTKIDKEQSYQIFNQNIEDSTIPETKVQILEVVENVYSDNKTEEAFRKALEQEDAAKARALQYFLTKDINLPEKLKEVLQSDEVSENRKKELVEKVDHSKLEELKETLEDEEVKKMISNHPEFN